MTATQSVLSPLDEARTDVEEKFSTYLKSEISLTQHDDGFFEKKYWFDHLSAKYQFQEAQNKFYIVLHELSK